MDKNAIAFQNWVHRYFKENGITEEQMKKGVKVQVPCTDGKTHEFVIYTLKEGWKEISKNENEPIKYD